MIRPIRCAAMDDCRQCMLSNMPPKLLQCMVDCELARQALRRHQGTWPRCAMHACTPCAWMTSVRRSGFARIACSQTAPMQFTNAASQPVMFLWPMRALPSSCARECLNFGVRGYVRALESRDTSLHSEEITSHHDSAIHAKHLASDITGFRRGEECHCAGNIFGRASFSERNFRLERLFDFIR